MAITIAELVAVPFLNMRFRAGAAGGGRLVTWAHSSDLPNPTEWLAAGELLMSNGLNLPTDAGGQVSFLLDLASAGLSGLAIGDGLHPPLSPEFLARAEELAFPVVAIPTEVPFVAVSRVVVNANTGEEQQRLVRTVQLYETLRGAVSTGVLGADLVAELGRQLDCRLVLIDIATALPTLRAEPSVPEGVATLLSEELRARGGTFPGVLRLAHEDEIALAMHVPAARPTALLALPGGRAPDLALLQHAATIAALAVERVTAEREQQRRLGSELLSQLLERRIEPASAQRRLDEHGIDPNAVVLVAIQANAGASGEGELHHELSQGGVAHLAAWTGERALAVLPDSEAAHGALRRALGRELVLGVSDPLRRSDRVPDAAREARWAQTAAQTLSRPLVRYGERTPLFLPTTLGEAELAAERVLGAIIAYDAAHASQLLHSLSVFLEHNRSWQRAAKVLFVHKQTLVYRMHRVEELSGRDLRDTADVAQLWLALRAHEFAHGELTGGASG